LLEALLQSSHIRNLPHQTEQQTSSSCQVGCSSCRWVQQNIIVQPTLLNVVTCVINSSGTGTASCLARAPDAMTHLSYAMTSPVERNISFRSGPISYTHTTPNSNQRRPLQALAIHHTTSPRCGDRYANNRTQTDVPRLIVRFGKLLYQSSCWKKALCRGVQHRFQYLCSHYGIANQPTCRHHQSRPCSPAYRYCSCYPRILVSMHHASTAALGLL
jgi:hypothetical protein